MRTFSVPEDWAGSPVYLHFRGVESAFYVWLNGDLVGYSEDTFTPAEFDLTPYLQPGENKLAVEVYRWCDASWLEDQDFWRLSGIFRGSASDPLSRPSTSMISESARNWTRLMPMRSWRCR